jgi:hypothetical protein
MVVPVVPVARRGLRVRVLWVWWARRALRGRAPVVSVVSVVPVVSAVTVVPGVAVAPRLMVVPRVPRVHWVQRPVARPAVLVVGVVPGSTPQV